MQYVRGTEKSSCCCEVRAYIDWTENQIPRKVNTMISNKNRNKKIDDSLFLSHISEKLDGTIATHIMHQNSHFLENDVRRKLSFYLSGVYPLGFGIRVLMVWKGTEGINMLTCHVISEAINSIGRTNWIKKAVFV